MKAIFRIALALFFAFTAIAIGQETQQKEPASDSFALDTTDNAVIVTSEKTIQAKDSLPKKEKIHSPKVATLLSTVAPGAGQIYNKKYWKAPVAWAGLGISIYYIILNNNNYIKYKHAYRDWIYTVRTFNDSTYVPPEANTHSYENLESLSAVDLNYYLNNNSDYVTSFLYNNRYNYKRYRDLSAIVTLGIYVLNIIDATVDAHLYDYDVADDLSLNIKPVVSPIYNPDPSFSLCLKLTF